MTSSVCAYEPSIQVLIPKPKKPNCTFLLTTIISPGGRNEPKSLEYSTVYGNRGTPATPILPHHRQSAAWSEKREQRRERIHELKSGDESDLFNPEREYYDNWSGSGTGPHFSNQLRYIKSTDHKRRLNINSQRPIVATNGHIERARELAIRSGTFHRNSRVPATENFLFPSETRRQTHRSRSGDTSSQKSYGYPPLRRLGEGDGEVSFSQLIRRNYIVLMDTSWSQI